METGSKPLDLITCKRALSEAVDHNQFRSLTEVVKRRVSLISCECLQISVSRTLQIQHLQNHTTHGRYVKHKEYKEIRYKVFSHQGLLFYKKLQNFSWIHKRVLDWSEELSWSLKSRNARLSQHFQPSVRNTTEETSAHMEACFILLKQPVFNQTRTTNKLFLHRLRQVCLCGSEEAVVTSDSVVTWL